MIDIWARVDEAIDTDPLLLRGIVGELLARAEAAEAVVDQFRRRHHRRTERHGSGCISCGRVWPCPDWREAIELLGSERPGEAIAP